MPSNSLEVWRTYRAAALDELETAHTSVGGRGAGRRFATRQLNYAYAVLLSSHFQGFCRDLHTECADYLAGAVAPATVQDMVRNALTGERKLDRGNPNAGNVGYDFKRFGVLLWDRVYQLDHRNVRRRALLDELADWRNAIAHQDFSKSTFAHGVLHLRTVQGWRRACAALAESFDHELAASLAAATGQAPW